jgi:uncharacterized membrane protein YuzA (DUF378 family)
MKAIDVLAAALVVVGGVNWGLVAVSEIDLVATVVGLEFGETNVVSRVVYGLVGLSAAYLAARLPALLGRQSTAPTASPATVR